MPQAPGQRRPPFTEGSAREGVINQGLRKDAPSTDPLTPSTFEILQERILGHPAFSAGSQFIPLDGDQWMGLSGLWVPPADPQKLYTGLTGVKRSRRRRGVATAVGLRAITFAKDFGAEVIETGNEDNNPTEAGF